MSTIEKIRSTLDTKLNQLQAQLSAFERQLGIGRDQALKQWEGQKKAFGEEAERIRAFVNEAERVSSDSKQKVQAAFDHLQVQLALGKAETRDAYHEQMSKLDSAIQSFEAEVDRAVGSTTEEAHQTRDDLQRRFVAAADAFRAEQEAISARIEEGEAKLKADFEEHRQDLATRIGELKRNLDSRRNLASERLGEFKDEVSSGIGQIREAFVHLFRS
ncbi:MAG: hypothetical protein ACFB9M_08295 [Myxococcota bacterium]